MTGDKLVSPEGEREHHVSGDQQKPKLHPGHRSYLPTLNSAQNARDKPADRRDDRRCCQLDDEFVHRASFAYPIRLALGFEAGPYQDDFCGQHPACDRMAKRAFKGCHPTKLVIGITLHLAHSERVEIPYLWTGLATLHGDLSAEGSVPSGSCEEIALGIN
jgi:hypothetical protein